MHPIEKISSAIIPPYPLIDIRTDREHFIFQFQRFDDNQTDYSIKAGGLTGCFAVEYQCEGIESSFECDITMGNVYDFYISLRKAYEGINKRGASASLRNYGEAENRTGLTINFDGKGRCCIEGRFSNKFSQHRSGIYLSFDADQSYIPEILGTMKRFFDESARIQGHSSFY